MNVVNLQDEARQESALFVVVMLLLGMLGPTVFLGLPAIVGQVERHWGFGEAALGLSSFIEVLGESTGTLLVAFVLGRQPVRLVLAGAVTLAAGANLGTLATHGLVAYSTLQFVAGVGSGGLNGIALRYRKTHLWVSEHGVVLPGDRYATVEWRGVRIGLLICYDSEFPETGRALAALGAQLILVTDGNMEPYRNVHRTSVTARAMENQVFAAVANRVGGGSHDVVFAGGSLAVDPFGNLIFEAGNTESRHAIELDFDQLAASRAVYDYRRDQRLQIAGERIAHADGRRELLIP